MRPSSGGGGYGSDEDGGESRSGEDGGGAGCGSGGYVGRLTSGPPYCDSFIEAGIDQQILINRTPAWEVNKLPVCGNGL